MLGVEVPETTLTKESRPTYGSDSVLNTMALTSPDALNGHLVAVDRVHGAVSGRLGEERDDLVHQVLDALQAWSPSPRRPG